MFYVNQQEIDKRLGYLSVLLAGCQELQEKKVESQLLDRLAAERILHLAIEVVTDVGSLLIDGFVMRDASSYEDIITIMEDERVVQDRLVGFLKDLVKLRKPLVQDYTELDNTHYHSVLTDLPEMLKEFEAGVVQFIAKEKAITGTASE